MKQTRPSDLELQVLSVLWGKGEATVRDVLGALPDGKKRAYTTVLSVMQVMEKKGLLCHKRDGLTHVYRPKVKRGRVLKPLMQNLVKTVFGGSPSAAVQYLLGDGKVDAQELSEIRRLLAETQPAAGNRTDRRRASK